MDLDTQISDLQTLRDAMTSDPADDVAAVDAGVEWLTSTREYPMSIVLRREYAGKMYSLIYRMFLDVDGVIKVKFVAMHLIPPTA